MTRNDLPEHSPTEAFGPFPTPREADDLTPVGSAASWPESKYLSKRDLFPNAPDYQLSSIPMQDDNEVWIWHRGPEDYVLKCSCGHWKGKAGGDTQATSRAMDHVLDHDIAYEEAYDDEDA